MSAVPPAPATTGRRASRAVFFVFALNGFVVASWLARLPAVRDALDLSPARIGLVLLVGSLGSVLALPLTGAVVQRVGTVRTIVAAAAVTFLGFAAVALAVGVGNVAWLAPALFGAQIGIAAWDVAMNLEGGAVEHVVRRAIMPRFHAGFSLGTVAGAGVGALAAAGDVPVEVHLLVVQAVVLLGVLLGLRGFLPPALGLTQESGGSRGQRARQTFGAWLEPRTLLVGVVVLAAALTEGAANDWIALAVVDGFDLPNAMGAVGFAVFVTAMTAMRLLGTGLLERYGRVAVLRLCSALALAGLLLFALSPWLWPALVGALLWGLGAALGFPVGMSAASDEPVRAAARVSVVASIGYTAFLAGPPLLGLLAEQVGYRLALLAVAVPLAVGLLLVPVARPVGPAAER
ncbi:MFS transporter [Georgenia sp. 10Sc9-8]|uniref:MFS transporter n=1 Tax=Georgenia halotolerans TaxID=3028317 RepID=A0ABT5U0V8_9MICO|nr:MFS transporter [Georgenia halotolerans]